MAKNNPMDQSQQPAAEAKPQARPEAVEPAQEARASRAQILTFALGLAFFLVLARVLDALLPGIPESHIERWVMLGFGVFLAGFLAWLK